MPQPPYGYSPQHTNGKSQGGSTACLPFRPRNQQARPLYRPASLRRSSPAPASSPASQHHHHRASPPTSPSIAIVEHKTTTGGWLLGGLLSPLTTDATKEFRFQVQSNGQPSGSMCALQNWRPDDDALICADSTCKQRFDVLHRRHHCRRCGDVFCSTHSARTALLWPHPHDPVTAPQTPLATPSASPRPTPRSSHADLPSLAMAATHAQQQNSTHGVTSPASSAFSIHSSSSSSLSSSAAAHTPHSSPPNSHRTAAAWNVGQPQQVRVCDACYFAAPTPPMHTPPLSAGGPNGPAATQPAFSVRPLTLRHPRSSSTPGGGGLAYFDQTQSPPKSRRREQSTGGSRSRSRQDSGVSAASSSAGGASSSHNSRSTSTRSTPPTSVDGHDSNASSSKSRSRSRTASPAGAGKLSFMLPRQPHGAASDDSDAEEEGDGRKDGDDDDGDTSEERSGDEGHDDNEHASAPPLVRKQQRREQRRRRQVEQLQDDQQPSCQQLLKMDKALSGVDWATF